MMIIGLGNDLIDIRRIEEKIEKYGERFLNRIFTPLEREKSEKRHHTVASYAKRFAAKEACSKALGTGIGKGVAWTDMGVVNLPSGKPTLVLTGGAERVLNQLVPAGYTPQIDLTITDDYPMAQAFDIISANQK